MELVWSLVYYLAGGVVGVVLELNLGRPMRGIVAFGDVVGVGCVAGLENLEFGGDCGEVLLRRFVAACISLGDMVGVGCELFGMLVGFVPVSKSVG